MELNIISNKYAIKNLSIICQAQLGQARLTG